MKNILSIIAISGLFLSGCATQPPLSPQQRRAIQVRSFENVSYDNVFKAFKTVLQDEGYIIKNQDLAGGLIVGSTSKTNSGAAFFAALGGQQNYQTGQTFELSINLEQVNKNLVESRLTLQVMSSYSMGGQSGREILDPKLYQAFYQKVFVEVERRKASGR